METRNQAKRTTTNNKTSNKSAPSLNSVIDLLANKNAPSQHKNAEPQQKPRYTPPSQRIAGADKRKKDGEEDKQIEPEERRKKKGPQEAVKGLTPYQQRLGVAKKQAIEQGKFKSANNSIREDGTIQLEGVLRGCSPFALDYDVYDDLSSNIVSTPQTTNTNSSQSNNAEVATPNVDQNPAIVTDRRAAGVEISEEASQSRNQDVVEPHLSMVADVPVEPAGRVERFVESSNANASVQTTNSTPVPPVLGEEGSHKRLPESENIVQDVHLANSSSTNASVNLAPVPLLLREEMSAKRVPVCENTVQDVVQANSRSANASVQTPYLAPALPQLAEEGREKRVPEYESIVQSVEQASSSSTTASVQIPSLAPVPPLFVDEGSQNRVPEHESLVQVTDQGNVDVGRVAEEAFDLQEELDRLERTILALGMLDHHAAFVEDCVRESVYPLGLRAFVPCAVFRSNNTLKKQWKQILHAASLELLTLCRMHYRRTEAEIKKELGELKMRGEGLKGEDRIEWEMKECNAWKVNEVRTKKLDETRKKKVKHAKTMHKEGRIFTENCLMERPPVGASNSRRVAETKTVTKSQAGRSENVSGEVEKNRQGMTTIASAEKEVELCQSDVRATNVEAAQCSQGPSIPPRVTTPLFESSEFPPPARCSANRKVPNPSYTNPHVTGNPFHNTEHPRFVRPWKKSCWLPYGNHNMLHPYWVVEPWEWMHNQSRWYLGEVPCSSKI